jgi:hypothetical protein
MYSGARLPLQPIDLVFRGGLNITRGNKTLRMVTISGHDSQHFIIFCLWIITFERTRNIRVVVAGSPDRGSDTR